MNILDLPFAPKEKYSLCLLDDPANENVHFIGCDINAG